MHGKPRRELLCAAKFQRRLALQLHIHTTQHALSSALMRTRRLNYERKTVLSVGARRVYVKRTTGKNLLCASLSLASHHRRTRSPSPGSLTHSQSGARPLYSSHLLLAIIFFSLTTRTFLIPSGLISSGIGTNIWFPFPSLCSAVSCLHMLSAAFSFPPCFIHFDFLCTFLSYVCAERRHSLFISSARPR
jgi:hypothetical protein